MADEQHYLYITSSYPTETYIKDGDTTNPITVNGNEITVTPGDYVLVKNYQYDDPVVHEKYNNQGYGNVSIWYVYTANNSWLYAGAQYAYNSQGNPYVDGEGKNLYNSSGHSLHFLDHEDNYPVYSEIIGNTNSTIVSCDNPMWQPHDYNNKIPIKDYSPNYIEYGYDYTDERRPDRALDAPLTTQAQFGDMACLCCIDEYGDENTLQFFYQYPGVWIEKGYYPDLTVQIPEPKYKGHVQLKWTDPQDITDWKPTPATWEGTVIVRKENSAPLHRWDGDKVVRTTTRDKYKSKPYKDEDIETNKVYYYAFMPYYTKIDDPQHPIRYYTFTKCIRVETGTISYIPEIIKIDMNEDVATITYAITLPATGPYDTAKLYGKKDGNPACDNTDDIVEDISQVDDQVIVPDIDGDYFFCIQVANGTDTLTSDVVSCSGETSTGGKWKNVKYNGETVTGWKPIKLDSVYLMNNGNTWASDIYGSETVIDESKITSQGVDVDLQRYVDITKSMDVDTYQTDVIYRGDKFNVEVIIYKNSWSLDYLNLDFAIDSVSTYIRIFDELSVFDGKNITFRFGLFENNSANIPELSQWSQGHPFAFALGKRSDSNYWMNGSGGENLYNMIHS